MLKTRIWFCSLLSHFSHLRLFVTLWTVAHQVPLSMGFSRQVYWSGLSCPPPGDHSDPGIEMESPMSPTLAGRFSTTSATWEARLQLSNSYLIWVIWSKESEGRRAEFETSDPAFQLRAFQESSTSGKCSLTPKTDSALSPVLGTNSYISCYIAVNKPLSFTDSELWGQGPHSSPHASIVPVSAHPGPCCPQNTQGHVWFVREASPFDFNNVWM